MELVVPTCEKIGEMFILILAGILSCKAGLLDEAMSKKLSNLLLMVVCPCLIINSYQIDYRPELFTGLVLCLLFSGISFALDVLVAHVVIRPDSGRDGSAMNGRRPDCPETRYTPPPSQGGHIPFPDPIPPA